MFGDCKSLNKVILPRENAKEIQDAIVDQTGKKAGNGKNDTIKFINYSDIAK